MSDEEDLSDILMFLDGLSGAIQELIKEIKNPMIKNFLGWHILYPLQKAIPEWVKTLHHNIKYYEGYTFNIN